MKLRAPLLAVAVAGSVLLPPPEMTVAQWAETYRVLSREDSAAPGRWSSTSRPYQTEIMEAASIPRIQYVTVVGGAQWGKTQILNNIMGQRIHLNPGPMMMVAPNERSAEKWSKTRFSPMIRDCPELAALLGDPKSRDSSNTILEKTFPGGLLVAVGANAPAGLASQPIRDLFIDELDRIDQEVTVGREGDFEDLAEARTSDFQGRRLIYKCSTPTILGRSRIEASWKASDQRRWFITCPSCGHEQTLDFRHVVFDGREEPVYACAGGGCEIKEGPFRQAVLAGRWVATRPHITDHAGFWVHGLMVRPMAVLAKGFLKAKAKGPGALQTFINTQLGEWWDDREGDALLMEGLLARREAYPLGEVPAGPALLVASVDVQTSPQRLELLIEGVGPGEETWVVDHQVIPGNLAMAEPWDRLEGQLRKDWNGLRVKACAVDIGGHFTRQVYQLAKRPALKGLVFPVRGATRPQQKLTHRANKARLWSVDTVAAKDQILARLKIDQAGPGFVHFPQDLDGTFFEQLLSERPCRKEGRRAYEKITADARNEALDLMVYALAALEIYAPRDLEALLRRVQARKSPPEAPPQAEEGVESIPDPTMATVRQIQTILARPGPKKSRLTPIPCGRGGGMTGFS